MSSNLFDVIKLSIEFDVTEWKFIELQLRQCQLTFQSCRACNEKLSMSWQSV